MGDLFVLFCVCFPYKESRPLAQSLQQMAVSLKVNDMAFFIVFMCIVTFIHRCDTDFPSKINV